MYVHVFVREDEGYKECIFMCLSLWGIQMVHVTKRYPLQIICPLSKAVSRAKTLLWKLRCPIVFLLWVKKSIFSHKELQSPQDMIYSLPTHMTAQLGERNTEDSQNKTKRKLINTGLLTRTRNKHIQPFFHPNFNYHSRNKPNCYCMHPTSAFSENFSRLELFRSFSKFTLASTCQNHLFFTPLRKAVNT